MIIEKVDLQNFRNYDYLNLNLDPCTNIIYGDNAQGKTNILEAVYVCATSRSHRGSKDKELIKFGCDESHIKVILDKHDTKYRIDMHIKKNKAKGIAINGVPIKRAIELFGIINIVLFSPEDLDIIKDGPAARRKFIDMELGQLDKIYLNDLVNYNKVLSQRNKLLKDLGYNSSQENLATLDIWDIQLSKYGRDIIKSREKFIKELNVIVNQIHSKISGGKENLELIYDPCVKFEEFDNILSKNRERDLYLKSTSAGPHKDDILFYINGNDVKKYGSQGQQRSAALSLKLAEIELVKKIIKDTPVLLLDDVMSELDSNRQRFLLESIDNIQTVVTCTGLDEFIENRFALDKIFKVINGSVLCQN